MSLVFLNSLEKKLKDGHIRRARVHVLEEDGIWRVIWDEENEKGEKIEKEWCREGEWDELVPEMKFRLAEKLGQGYVPMLDSLPGLENPMTSHRYGTSLHYYSEKHYNAELFEKLSQWRKESAAREGTAPYMIAVNRLLKLIAAFVPHTKEELLQLPGVGQMKADRFGDEILHITRKFKRKKPFPLDWVEREIDEAEWTRWKYRRQALKYRRELEERKNRKRILQAVKEGCSLQDLQTECSLSRRELLQYLEELHEEGHDVKDVLNEEIGRIPDAERKAAETAFEEQGDRYLKPLLQSIYKPEELKDRNLDDLYDQLRIMRLYRKVANTVSP